MVLRRVTAELIEEVLAEPCEVTVEGEEDATALFRELAREHTLVQQDPDGALRFRQDLRAPMLHLLEQDRPQQVHQIHQRAVAYYSRIKGGDSLRAEELYHRLALDQEPGELEARWRASAGSLLAGAVEEFPLRARIWMSGKLGLDLPEEVRAQVSVLDWERVIGRKVWSLLRYSEPEEALKLLGEREERSPGSPLFALEAKALLWRQQHDRALTVLERGVESMCARPNRGRMAELLWLQAQALELVDRASEAAGALERAREVAETIVDPRCRMQILTALISLGKRRPEALSSEEVARHQADLAALLATARDSDLDSERGLSRAAGLGLGSGYPREFTRVLRLVGLGPTTSEEAAELTEGLREWVRSRSHDGTSPTQVTDSGFVLSDLNRKDLDLNRLIPLLLDWTEAHAVILPLLEKVLRNQGMALSAANLAGIDEYREPWELELSPEAA